MHRAVIVGVALLVSLSARASEHWKAISIEGCTSLAMQPALSASAQTPGNLTDAMVSVGWDDAVYLCDADLPSTATAFDYADFEYLGGTDSTPPWVVAYVDTEVRGYGGRRYSRVEEIGGCGGEQTPAGPWMPGYIPNMTVCQTSGSLSWGSNPPDSSVERVSVFFLVFAPTWNGGYGGIPTGPDPWSATPMNSVYRLIVHFDSP